MKILIIGDGRIGQALAHFCREADLSPTVSLLSEPPSKPQAADIVFGALPGGCGPATLEYAIESGTDVVDIADVEFGAYAKLRDAIRAAGIRAVVGCGLCPGILDLLIGHELRRHPAILEVDAAAGTLSPRDHFFPFLWCLEDMVAEFLEPSEQVVDGQRRTFPAFGGRRRERYSGLRAESYYGQSGFEELADAFAFQRFTYRNIRPLGFEPFFRYLNNHGFLSTENFPRTRQILQSQCADNVSVGFVRLADKERVTTWQIRCEAKADDRWNSMQRITALVAIGVARGMLAGQQLKPGLFAGHDLGRAQDSLSESLGFLRDHGVELSRCSRRHSGGHA